MTIQVQALKRIFTFNGVTLADPGPDFSPEEVKDLYAAAYPDLATAAIESEPGSDAMTYKFIRAVGTKG